MEFKPRRNHFLVSIISLLFFFSCSESGREAPLVVLDAYLKKPLEGALSSAAYMSLKNTSSYKIKIKGLTCNNLLAELHQTVLTDSGMTSMNKLNLLTLEPKSEITLLPGKEHIMLMGKSMSNKNKGIKCDLILESVNSVQTFNRVPVFFEIRD
jgi:copper(I)-binding protein